MDSVANVYMFVVSGIFYCVYDIMVKNNIRFTMGTLFSLPKMIRLDDFEPFRHTVPMFAFVMQKED